MLFEINTTQLPSGLYRASCPFPGCEWADTGMSDLSPLSRLIKHIGQSHGAEFVIDGGRCPCGRKFLRWGDTPVLGDIDNIRHLMACEAFASDLTVRAMAKLGGSD